MDPRVAKLLLVAVLCGVLIGISICRLMRASAYLANKESFEGDMPAKQSHEPAYEYDAGLAEGFYVGSHAKTSAAAIPKYSGALPTTIDAYQTVDFAVQGPRDKLASRAYLDFVSNGLLGASPPPALAAQQ